MIPLYSEPTSIKAEFGNLMEDCIFCEKPTDTWHENTNNPICMDCANKYKISDIKEDFGQNIRRAKRNGTFDREDSVRVN